VEAVAQGWVDGWMVEQKGDKELRGYKRRRRKVSSLMSVAINN